MKNTILKLRKLLNDELGSTDSGIKGLYLNPGTPLEVDGLRCVVERNPITAGTPITGGTYFPSLYKLTLVNFVIDKNSKIAARNMSSAIRKIDSNFTVERPLYFPPTSDTYEMAIRYLFLPNMECV